MKHRYRKVRFGYGKDANKMLLRKLAYNFLSHGKLETTKQKAKAAQSIVEHLVTKAKTNSEADKRFILRNVTDPAIIKVLISEIVPALSNVTSGYTRIINVGKRQTDAADIARLEWAYPVVIGKKDKPTAPAKVKKTKDTEKKDNTS